MAYDGHLKFDTKVNTDGMKSGFDKMKSLASKGVAAISAAAAAGIGAAINMGMNFEEQMSKVGSICLASADDMAILKAKAQEMGEKTVFSATQAGQAFEYMAMAGWKTEEMTAGIEGIMNLAAASGEDLARTSDIVTDALTAFGMKAKDSGHFSDVLASASSNANTNVGLMGETFKYVAPVAGAMKFSVEDTATAIGLMANAGIKGSQAGTALRSTFVRLSKPPKEAAEAIEALNLHITNADGSFHSLSEIMAEMRTKFAQLTDAERTQYAAMIGGQEAMSGLLAIVNASEADFNKLQSAIGNCNGTAKEMAERNLDNLKGQLTLAGSAAESVAIAVYDGIEKPMKEAVKEGTKQLSELSRCLKSGELKPALANMGKSLGELTTTVITLATKAIPKLISGISFIGNNFKSIIAVIGGAKLALTAYNTTMIATATATKALTTAKKLLNKMEESNALLLVTTNGGLKVHQMLVGLCTKQLTLHNVVVGLAAKAQNVLNAAWAANPIGIVVAGLVALAAAIYVIIEHQKKQKDATDLAIESANKRLEQIKEETKSYEELRQAQTEQATTDLMQVQNTQTLALELQRLVGANGEVAQANQNRVNFILGELNSAYGTEYKMIDGVVQRYQTLQAEIDNLIEKKKAEILFKAAQPLYEKAITEELKMRTQAAEDLMKVEEQRDKVNALIAENEKKYAEDTSAFRDIAKAERESEYKNEIELLADLEKNYNKSMSNIKGAMADKTAYETAAQQISDNNFQGALKTLEAYGSGFTKAMAKAEGNTKKQKKIVKEEFEKTQKALTTYLDNCKKGVETFNEDTVTKLVEHTKTVYDEGLEVGINLGQGMLDGIDSQKIPLTNDMKTLCEAVIAQAKASFDQHSPSKEFEKIGVNNVLGLNKGTEKKKKSAVKTYKEAAKATKEAFEKEWANVETNYELGDISEADKFNELETLRDKYFAKGTKEFVKYTKQINDYNEKALKERYQTEQKELKYRYDRGKISAKEYYSNLGILRDNYFKDTDEEYRSITLEIINYEKDIIRSAYKEISEYATEHINEVIKAQESLETKLKSFGKLTSTVTIKGAGADGKDITAYRLADLKAQTAQMQAFAAALTAVKQRVSRYDSEEIADFLTALPNMSIDELNAFNRANDADFDSYMAAWLEQQKTAKQASTQYYADDMDKAVEKSIENARKKLEEAGFKIPEGFFKCGTTSAERFGKAFCDEITKQMDSVRELMNNFAASIAPRISVAGAASGGSVTTYNQSFVVGSAKNTVGEQISSWKNAVALQRLRGG